MRIKSLLKLGLIILITILCGGLTYYLKDKKYLEPAFTHSSYYIIWVGILYLLYVIYPKITLGFSAEHRKGHLIAMAAALILTALVFLAIPIEFRVLADETNLLNASQAFYEHREATHPIEAFYYYNQLHYVSTDVPHRPLLWPFLASLLHTFSGYTPVNGFVLNFLVCFASLAMLINLGTRMGDTKLGMMAAVVLVSYPLYAINVTSSGYDPLNLMLILFLYAAIHTFLKDENAHSLEILAVTLALAAQGRYETAVLGLPVLVIVLFHFKKIKWEELSPFSFLIPILFLPTVWQRILSPDVRNAGDKAAVSFSFKFLVKHLKNAAEFIVMPGEPRYPNSQIILLLAAVGLILALWCLFKKCDKQQRKMALIFGSVIAIGQALIVVIHLSYYLSDLRQPFISRLLVAQLGIMAMLAAFALRTFMTNRTGKTVAIFALFFLPLYHWPIAAFDANTKSLVMFREYHFARAFLKKQTAQNILVVSDRPSLFVGLGYGGINFDYANDNVDDLKRNISYSLFEDIFVIRHINMDTLKADEKFSDKFNLEKVAAIQVDAEQMVQIDRILEEPTIIKPKPATSKKD